jgi:hypothetical protein
MYRVQKKLFNPEYYTEYQISSEEHREYRKNNREKINTYHRIYYHTVVKLKNSKINKNIINDNISIDITALSHNKEDITVLSHNKEDIKSTKKITRKQKDDLNFKQSKIYDLIIACEARPDTIAYKTTPNGCRF